MPFTNEFKDKYVAPGISAFTAASIPDAPSVGTEHGHWLNNFILNSAFRVTMDDAYRRTVFNFLRRAEAAFRAFAAAREATLAFLAEPSMSGYFVTIGLWEEFLSLAYQAWNVIVRGEPVLFHGKDGSLAQRLNYLYNVTKHIESAVKSDQFPADGTLPVWLTNDGLQSVGYKLSFQDVAEVLEGLATWADAAQDPPTMVSKIMAVYGLSEEDLGPGPAAWYRAESLGQSASGAAAPQAGESVSKSSR